MRRKFFFIVSICIAPIIAQAQNQVIWTAVFSDVQPRTSNISYEFCLAHSPTVMVTTVSQVLSKKGVKSLNGIVVKYLSYKSHKKDGILFNTINAVVSGKDSKGNWSSPMKMYQQTLSEKDQGKTWVVWSTPKCKGSFIGTPTIVQK